MFSFGFTDVRLSHHFKGPKYCWKQSVGELCMYVMYCYALTNHLSLLSFYCKSSFIQAIIKSQRPDLVPCKFNKLLHDFLPRRFSNAYSKQNIRSISSIPIIYFLRTVRMYVNWGCQNKSTLEKREPELRFDISSSMAVWAGSKITKEK